MATLYAQPSKEWVIPAKPKPGRKPKRDDPVVEEDSVSDSKAKKVQNRAAQRAFRERKQSQLADLQARLTQYEQGEIERNVALQNVAKKLKEENERLKSAKPDAPPLEFESTIVTRKRSRADSSTLSIITSVSSSSSTPTPISKRKRGKDETSSKIPHVTTRATSTAEPRRSGSKSYTTLPPDYVPPPQLVHIYSPAVSDGSSRPSLVMSPVSSENSHGPEPSSLDEAHLDEDDIMEGYSNDKHHDSEFESTIPESDELHVVDCGFCSREPGSCVCREVSAGINHLLESASSSRKVQSARAVLEDDESYGASPTTSKPSILDNLPPVQPGVPLRLRRSKRTNPNANTSDSGPVHLTPVPQFLKPTPAPAPSIRPVCSGDPSNCAACADDPFGRAFCTALASGVICRNPNCKQCTKPQSERPQSEPVSTLPEDKGKGKSKANPMDIDVGSSSGVGLGMGMSMETGMLLCCGDPKLCGGGICGVRAPSSPIKTAQRPALQASSSTLSIHPESNSRSMQDSEDERDKPDRLPSISSPGQNDMVLDNPHEIPTNEAWERLKSHPNVAFADLSLLADVVAGRTKCTSSRVRLSLTPERDVSRLEHEDSEDYSEVLEGDSGQISPHSHPILVPQEALVRCGRERLMRVQAEGVRDALAMLDVQRPNR
ncbi:basic region leucin zipper, partial [Rhizoctonia solani]